MNILDRNGKGILLLGLFAFFSVTIAAQVNTFTGPGFTVVDGQARVVGSCSTVVVSGIATNVTVSNIQLTNVDHGYIGDTQTMVYRPGVAGPPALGATVSSPPDITPCNFFGNYRYIDTAPASVDTATTGCGDVNLAPGDYRSSVYGGGVANGADQSLTTLFGTLTPAQANGNWLVCLFDYATPDGGTVGGTSLTLAGPTAAGVTVSGRVMMGEGARGLVNAYVTITSQQGVSRSILTGKGGIYSFSDIEAGQTYTMTVRSRLYSFAPRVLQVNDSLSDVDFTP